MKGREEGHLIGILAVGSALLGRRPWCSELVSGSHEGREAHTRGAKVATALTAGGCKLKWIDGDLGGRIESPRCPSMPLRFSVPFVRPPCASCCPGNGSNRPRHSPPRAVASYNLLPGPFMALHAPFRSFMRCFSQRPSRRRCKSHHPSCLIH